MNDVFNILGVWLADLNEARFESINVLNNLQKVPTNDLVQSALICHLRLKTKRLIKKR